VADEALFSYCAEEEVAGGKMKVEWAWGDFPEKYAIRFPKHNQ
jgi:hypothetical protein